MIRSLMPGRILLAVAIAAFGIEALIHVFAAGFPWLSAPWPSTGLELSRAAAGDPALPGGPAAAIACGVLLLALALGMTRGKWTSAAAASLAAVCLVTAGIAWIPRLLAAPGKPRAWTPTFELLAIAGAALILAGAPPGDLPAGSSGRRGADAMRRTGRLLFAVSLPVFGVLHFLYAPGLAKLLPAWIPFHLFWIYFFGVAFFAAAVAIASGVAARLAGTLVGVMYLVWVVTLHLPLGFAAPHDGDLWTSAFVALAWAGCGWIAAGADTSQPEK